MLTQVKKPNQEKAMPELPKPMKPHSLDFPTTINYLAANYTTIRVQP
jgi:hypothetical protein